MITLFKEQVTKTYNGNIVITEEVEQYFYDTKNERDSHSATMLHRGFSDSGQVAENVGTLANPVYKHFASYYKGKKEVK